MLLGWFLGKPECGYKFFHLVQTLMNLKKRYENDARACAQPLELSVAFCSNLLELKVKVKKKRNYSLDGAYGIRRWKMVMQCPLCVCRWGTPCLGRLRPSVWDFGIGAQSRSCSGEGNSDLRLWVQHRCPVLRAAAQHWGAGWRGGSAEEAGSVWFEEQTSTSLQGQW